MLSFSRGGEEEEYVETLKKKPGFHCLLAQLCQVIISQTSAVLSECKGRQDGCLKCCYRVLMQCSKYTKREGGKDDRCLKRENIDIAVLELDL